MMHVLPVLIVQCYLGIRAVDAENAAFDPAWSHEQAI
jgi:hypothetical protein